jgi:hypothetical protein
LKEGGGCNYSYGIEAQGDDMYGTFARKFKIDY